MLPERRRPSREAPFRSKPDCMADAVIEASHASCAASEPEPSGLPTVSLDKPPASAGAKPAAKKAA